MSAAHWVHSYLDILSQPHLALLRPKPLLCPVCIRTSPFTRTPLPPGLELQPPLYFSPNSTKCKVIRALVHTIKGTKVGPPPQPREEPADLLCGI